MSSQSQEIVIRGIGWGEVRPLDYVSGNPTYLAKHKTHGAATSAPDWRIWKYTWVSGNCTRIQGELVGSIDDRATLGW